MSSTRRMSRAKRFDPRMTPERACALAERVHRGQRDAGGMPVIDHVRRVAATVDHDARVVAWLHEILEYTAITEATLLADGLKVEELRALRLLTRDKESRADTIYLAHIELLARAAGPGARIARCVKRADLTDRAAHPARRADGWTPPYELGLELLNKTSSPAGRATGSGRLSTSGAALVPSG